MLITCSSRHGRRSRLVYRRHTQLHSGPHISPWTSPFFLPAYPAETDKSQWQTSDMTSTLWHSRVLATSNVFPADARRGTLSDVMAPGLIGAAALAAAVSLAVHIALNCPIDPVPSPPAKPAWYPRNNVLQGAEKLGEGRLDGPEDVYVEGGTVYTATRDGWLQRMLPNGSWEHWRFVGGTGLLGITPSADGSMLVCDADKGLLRVEENRVTILASTVDGATIKFADAAIEASDGTVYFSDVSTRFGFGDWFLGYVEARATGRLLKYDPRTGKASVALDNLFFANGVALSRHEDFVVVCESGGFRCSKLWLKGEKAGQAETFVDDLPGSPDNIHLAPDGSFWVALFQLRSPLFDLINRWTFTKRVAASIPGMLGRIKDGMKGGMVAQVSESGEIIRVLDDSEGKVTSFITSVMEFDGHLFFGSLSNNFVGRLSLAKVPQGL